MTLSQELEYRNFVNQFTFDDITKLDGEPITFYWGVDPSGPSMTVGHLAPAMMIRHFMEHGHKAILLIGGATGMIGDPDGKKQERDLMSVEQIESNKKNLISQYEKIFAGLNFEVVDNFDWFKDIGYLEFLREVGKCVPMSQMLGRDFIKSRLGEGNEGISYAEFSYSLIQGYDYLHLYRTKGTTLQVAGADQWGNSLAGVELIKRLDGGESHVFTTPLIINNSTGIKFGKTEDGAVWLDETLTTPYRYYQFWLNMDDDFAKELILKYTMLDKQHIEEIIAEHELRPKKRLLQRKLADESLKIVHGVEKLNQVHRMIDVLFGSGDPAELLEENIKDLASEIPVTDAGMSLTETLVNTKVAKSKSEARRLVEGGGVRVNGRRSDDGDFILNSKTLIKVGKNRFILVQ